MLSFLLISAVAMSQCTTPCNAKQEKLLRHVVLFSWNEDTPEDVIREMEAAFAALPEKIDAIHDFEWGTDVSVENLAKGFTHCFIVTFKTEAERDKYLPHPAHKEFVSLILPHKKDVLVIDYWSH